MAIPAQLRMVEKLLEPESMGIPDTGYLGPKLSEDPRYGRSCGNSQPAKSWQCTIDQTRSSESNHRDRVGLRGDVTEVIFARNPSVPGAWSGTEPNADPGGGYKIGHAVRARVVAIRGDE